MGKIQVYYGIGTGNAGGFLPGSGYTSQTGISWPGISGVVSGNQFYGNSPGAIQGFPAINNVWGSGSGQMLSPFLLKGSTVDQPTPYLSVNEEPIHAGKKEGSLTNFTLNGQLYGGEGNPTATYEKLIDFENQVISNFHQQWQPFIMVEELDDGQKEVVFARDFVKVESINFAQSKHVGVSEYAIEFSSYNLPAFYKDMSATHTAEQELDYNVIDKENNFSFQQNGDGTATLTHTISAKGLPRFAVEGDGGYWLNMYSSTETWNAGSADSIRADETWPFRNAVKWVKAQAGFNKVNISPSYVQWQQEPVLMSRSESKDLLNGTYSLTEEYLYNTLSAGSQAGGGGGIQEIMHAIENTEPITISYSFTPADVEFVSCAPGGKTIAPSANTQAAAANATELWSRLFHAAYPNAYARGFRLNWTNKGIENWGSTTPFPAQDVHNEYGYESYSLTSGPAADAGVGDLRIGEADLGIGLAGCSSLPQQSSTRILGSVGGADMDLINSTNYIDIAGNWDSRDKLMMHEMGHSLGFGHDHDTMGLNVMTYGESDPNVIAGVGTDLLNWWPDTDSDGIPNPERSSRMVEHVKSIYGQDIRIDSNGNAIKNDNEKPVTRVTTSINHNADGDFDSVDVEITLIGGHAYTLGDLWNYVNAGQFWVPGQNKNESKTLFQLAREAVPAGLDVSRYPGVYDHNVYNNCGDGYLVMPPSERAKYLNSYPSNYEVEEVAGGPEVDWDMDGTPEVTLTAGENSATPQGPYASEIRVTATFQANDIFDNVLSDDGTYIVWYGNEDAVPQLIKNGSTVVNGSDTCTSCTIPFSSSQNNNGVSLGTNAYFDYEVEVSRDGVTDISEVSINGRIVTKNREGRKSNENDAKAFLDWIKEGFAGEDVVGGIAAADRRHYHPESDAGDGWFSHEGAASSTVDFNWSADGRDFNGLSSYLFRKANNIYKNQLGNTCWRLDPRPKSINMNKNPFDGTYELSATFTDKDWIRVEDVRMTEHVGLAGNRLIMGAISDIDWSINMKTPMPKFEPHQSCHLNGHFLIYDVGTLQRAKIDVSLSAKSQIGARDIDAQEAIVQYANSNFFYLNYKHSSISPTPERFVKNYVVSVDGTDPAFANFAPTVQMNSESMSFDSRGTNARVDEKKDIDYKVSYSWAAQHPKEHPRHGQDSPDKQFYRFDKDKTIIKGSYVDCGGIKRSIPKGGCNCEGHPELVGDCCYCCDWASKGFSSLGCCAAWVIGGQTVVEDDWSCNHLASCEGT